MASWLLAGSAALILMLAPTGALGFPDGAPPGHTGGFGEPACGACHYADEDTAPPGDLHLHGLQDKFEAGRTYLLELRLDSPGQAVGGFQLTARYADGDARGRTAGRLEGVDDDIDVMTQQGVPYLGHGQAAPLTGNKARWHFRWTAPEAPAGPVVFHVTAVVGNDDESPLGDDVYMLERLIDVTEHGR